MRRQFDEGVKVLKIIILNYRTCSGLPSSILFGGLFYLFVDSLQSFERCVKYRFYKFIGCKVLVIPPKSTIPAPLRGSVVRWFVADRHPVNRSDPPSICEPGIFPFDMSCSEVVFCDLVLWNASINKVGCDAIDRHGASESPKDVSEQCHFS